MLLLVCVFRLIVCEIPTLMLSTESIFTQFVCLLISAHQYQLAWNFTYQLLFSYSCIHCTCPVSTMSVSLSIAAYIHVYTCAYISTCQYAEIACVCVRIHFRVCEVVCMEEERTVRVTMVTIT